MMMIFGEEFDDPSENWDSDLQSDEKLGPNEQDATGKGFDLLNISDPMSAYFLLSDDVLDELNGEDKTRMKCLSCGHRFIGEVHSDCPQCYSPDTEELISRINDDEWYSM